MCFAFGSVQLVLFMIPVISVILVPTRVVVVLLHSTTVLICLSTPNILFCLGMISGMLHVVRYMATALPVSIMAIGLLFWSSSA